jgi:hypothetical protein
VHRRRRNWDREKIQRLFNRADVGNFKFQILEFWVTLENAHLEGIDCLQNITAFSRKNRYDFPKDALNDRSGPLLSVENSGASPEPMRVL